MTHTSYRLSDEDKQLLKKIAEHYGVTEAGVIRMMIRRVAREEGIQQEASRESNVVRLNS